MREEKNGNCRNHLAGSAGRIREASRRGLEKRGKTVRVQEKRKWGYNVVSARLEANGSKNEQTVIGKGSQGQKPGLV